MCLRISIVLCEWSALIVREISRATSITGQRAVRLLRMAFRHCCNVVLQKERKQDSHFANFYYFIMCCLHRNPFPYYIKSPRLKKSFQHFFPRGDKKATLDFARSRKATDRSQGFIYCTKIQLNLGNKIFTQHSSLLFVLNKNTFFTRYFPNKIRSFNE